MTSERPTVSHNEDTKGYVEKHPAYGAITVSRPWSGKGLHLFGSNTDQKQMVTLKVSTATLERDLHNDWIFPRETILEFSMTEAQWALFATNRGMGDSFPVTLEMAPKDRTLERLPEIEPLVDNRKEQFDEEVEAKLHKTLENIANSVKQLEELANGKSVSKVALRDAIGRLKITTSNLPSDLRFSVDQFKETTYNMVNDAKLEVEAYVMNAANRVGLRTIREQAEGPMLPFTKEEANDI
jgi:hypothetical protein